MSRKNFKIFQKTLTDARKKLHTGDQLVATLPVEFMSNPEKYSTWAESIGMKFIEAAVNATKPLVSPAGYPCCGHALIEKVAIPATH